MWRVLERKRVFCIKREEGERERDKRLSAKKGGNQYNLAEEGDSRR